jgi:putative transposase
MKEQPMSDEKPMSQVIPIDEARIRDHLGEMVRGTVEETLNAILMPKLIGYAARGVMSAAKPARIVLAAIPKLRGRPLKRQLSNVYLAGISVRRVEDIREALSGTRVSPSTVSNLNKKI